MGLPIGLVEAQECRDSDLLPVCHDYRCSQRTTVVILILACGKFAKLTGICLSMKRGNQRTVKTGGVSLSLVIEGYHLWLIQSQ